MVPTEKELMDMGYLCVCEMAEELIGIHPFIFTTAIIRGIDHTGYEERWCYKTFEDAALALAEWNGLDHPPGQWHRYLGYGPIMIRGPDNNIYPAGSERLLELEIEAARLT